MPYSIEKLQTQLNIESSLVALDSSNVQKYIEKNRELGGGMFLFDLYSYYPVGVFPHKSIIFLIIEKSGGAGGVERLFFLLTYNGDGEKIDSCEFAKEVGDCSHLNIKTGQIDKNYEVKTEEITYKINCDTEQYSILNKNIQKLQISHTGKIVKSNN